MSISYLGASTAAVCCYPMDPASTSRADEAFEAVATTTTKQQSVSKHRGHLFNTSTPRRSSAVDLDRQVDLSCLADQPPIPNHSVRIFLCRHGQTENNRLRKVQGARVDPPINTNGLAQATNLGKALALARMDDSDNTTASINPSLIFSSNLQRAKMTATIVAQELSSASSSKTSSTIGRSSNNIPRGRSIPSIRPKVLDSLREVDFGPIADGQPVSKVQQRMTNTYARWSIGQIDYRPDPDGESGRDVLNRACDAIEDLVQQAVAAQSSSVVAVSHSAFLRVMLGILLDESLLQASSRKIWNGSVTIVDVPNDNGRQVSSSSSSSFGLKSGSSSQSATILSRRSKLLGGIFSQTPNDFQLFVREPSQCHVVRVSEFRHLPPSTLLV